jgi:hypothetical protein
MPGTTLPPAEPDPKRNGATPFVTGPDELSLCDTMRPSFVVYLREAPLSQKFSQHVASPLLLNIAFIFSEFSGHLDAGISTMVMALLGRVGKLEWTGASSGFVTRSVEISRVEAGGGKSATISR